LGNRIVAVFDEDLLVEVVSSIETNGGIDGGVPGEIEVTHEFVEKESP
jgi:hypothetical protein